MKNKGKIFEEDFANSFPQNIFIYRLRDTSSSWQNDNNNSKSRFTVKNICDFIAFSNINKKILLLELKSFKGSSCPFTNIKMHQLEGLYAQSLKDGVGAYFIFNFRDISETYGVKAEKVYAFYENTERRSFSYEWCRENGIFIDSKLKRTRFAYSIDKLLSN
ncbi:Holliday junction resolvase RecU [Clostridium botulinum]|uniref:Holliday junction resolvase RecU n=1 Tax=Clostridium botulinum TaxID=1491 RepID=UPI001C9B0BB2|nr:Holliday junction resolvase RecU [Clostridium botulinum]MBY6811868.1 Holliday junction resolvase RecU [Clostridium botulinum]MBY6825350.1 Holliday junction resolvase RecU [Clostridium botulinum]MBY6835707.1 Holliday junction resolvase RecU [Clostridium botulinum]MBY6974397.1 Holliday junction resolvase RecU [Clostridium botulinum]MCS6105439.1 hypothetical protein [Clostridium botulinum]